MTPQEEELFKLIDQMTMIAGYFESMASDLASIKRSLARIEWRTSTYVVHHGVPRWRPGRCSNLPRHYRHR